jgi:3-oxoacyl-[acyl-carrier protein] reductase
MMDLGLRQKVAVVTGTGSQKGMGKAVALTLAEAGCDVAVTDIDFEGANITAEAINDLGVRCLALKADVTKSIEVDALVNEVLKLFGKIDILMNIAGALIVQKPIADMNEADWDSVIDVNLKSAFLCSKAVIGGMLSRKSGKIINIGSIASYKGFPSGTGYCAAKSGITGFTRALAAEVAPAGINVNCICPGFVPTNFGGGMPPDIIAKLSEKIPKKRAGTTQDIANMAALLCSDLTSFVVGQVIFVDGGETIV